ncbi:MAG: metallophosphoesterase family protein [Lachnospiraceae bacterium]|nr:metallophosphoesterase family protein [Lachnospiraceae bacterium]
MGQIWLTSDMHFCHDRDFIFKPRGFETVEEMNEAIVRNWNLVVKDGDDVYVLGDCMLKDNETGIQLMKSLKGRLHIILGNHDTDARRKLYATIENVVEILYATVLKYRGYHFYLSHYPTLCGNYDDSESLKTRLISLCGHAHTPDRFADWEQGVIYHCELDAHDCRPVSIDEVVEDCEKKWAE